MTSINRGVKGFINSGLGTLAVLMLSGAGPLFVPATAHAALFALSIEDPSGTVTITARIEGALQSDNNTVLVSGISDVTVNGAAAPAITFFDARSEFIGDVPAADPLLTLDGGPVIDFIACAAGCAEGFLLHFDDDDDLFSTSNAFGGIPTSFRDSDYSLVAVATVPGPAGVGLVSLGLGALALLRRRARRTL